MKKRNTLTVGLLLWLSPMVAAALPNKDEWRPERYRVTVPNARPQSARSPIELIKLKLKPPVPSPTATELLSPILVILNKLDYNHIARVVVENAEAINRSDNLTKTPQDFRVQSLIATTENLSKLKKLDFMVAQRSLIALKKYKMSDREVYGKVCVDLPRIAEGKSGVDSEFEFKMPGKELLKIVSNPRDEKRFGGVMMEHKMGEVFDLDQDKTLDVVRFTIPSFISVEWDYKAKVLLAQGVPQDKCVLRLELKKALSTSKSTKLRVPKTKRILTADAFQVRVAPLGKRLYGYPKVKPLIAENRGK